MHSALPSFVPFSPSGPPLLGCCETPAVSLAEAQQELQMLQKQLGESEPRLPGCARSAWLGLDGGKGRQEGMCLRRQMEGQLACFLSEVHLLLSLGCAHQLWEVFRDLALTDG